MIRFLFTCILSLPVLAQSIPAEAVTLVNEAQAAFASGDTTKAATLASEALALAPDGCSPCHKIQFNIHFRLKAYADAIASLDALAVDESGNLLGSQYLRIGFVLVEQDKLSKKDAALAETALTKAMAANPGLTIAHFHLARLYDRLGRDQDTVAQFEQFLAKNVDNQLSGSVMQRVGLWNFERTGQLSSMPVDPLNGADQLDFTRYRGKVVLVVLWTTDNKASRRSQPGLRLIQKRYEDRPFAVISIAGDAGKQNVLDYLAADPMDWPQYHDNNLGLVERFKKVNAYPTFWVVDGQGRIVYDKKGWTADLEKKLKQAIGKAMTALPATNIE